MAWAADLAPYQSPTYRAISISTKDDSQRDRGTTVLHTIEQVKEQLLLRGVSPDQFARALMQKPKLLEHEHEDEHEHERPRAILPSAERDGIGGTITLELFRPHLLAERVSQAGEPAHRNLVLIGVARDHNTLGGSDTRRTVVIAARLSLGN